MKKLRDSLKFSLVLSIRRLEQLGTTLIHQLEKEDMTIKGSLLNSVLGQDRLQGIVITVAVEMQEERRSYIFFGVTTFGLFFSRLRCR